MSTIPPLVPNDDFDLATWQAGQQETFLDLASQAVRTFCGWHVSPIMSVSAKRCWLSGRDLIMLPSTHVTDVGLVSVDGVALTADYDYFWDYPKPWLRHRSAFWPRERFALVDFTHGYAECPSDMKTVIFEVVATAMELPASNASRVRTLEHEFYLNPNVGIALSDNQKERLGKYRVWKFGGAQP